MSDTIITLHELSNGQSFLTATPPSVRVKIDLHDGGQVVSSTPLDVSMAEFNQLQQLAGDNNLTHNPGTGAIEVAPKTNSPVEQP